jgi:REP element-mobilizing transposase RayT
MPGLKRAAHSRLKSPPIFLSEAQAAAVLDQFHETASYRGWQCLAVAIMRTHIHLISAVAGDPNPDSVLNDYKAYASRKLNAR